MSSRGWRSPSKAPGQWAWHACLAGSILEHAPGLMHLTPGHHAPASHEDLVDISQHHRPFAALSWHCNGDDPYYKRRTSMSRRRVCTYSIYYKYEAPVACISVSNVWGRDWHWQQSVAVYYLQATHTSLVTGFIQRRFKRSIVYISIEDSWAFLGPSNILQLSQSLTRWPRHDKQQPCLNSVARFKQCSTV